MTIPKSCVRREGGWVASNITNCVREEGICYVRCDTTRVVQEEARARVEGEQGRGVLYYGPEMYSQSFLGLPILISTEQAIGTERGNAGDVEMTWG